MRLHEEVTEESMEPQASIILEMLSIHDSTIKKILGEESCERKTTSNDSCSLRQLGLTGSQKWNFLENLFQLAKS